MNRQIVENIRQLKRKLIPNERLILFGSQARGDARPDSDWDLLVLLNKKGKHSNEDYYEVGFPFEETGWEFGVTINPVIFTNDEWEQGKIFPFYKNVTREGIEII
ncbi:MAG: nucleotidyltransferase domain-containing protein [Bacteroidales bacterium]|jgi:DNA polymerase sigma|nr:nucleotidyltransferase domain-containing protein [Bacteroidales bacterium]